MDRALGLMGDVGFGSDGSTLSNDTDASGEGGESDEAGEEGDEEGGEQVDIYFTLINTTPVNLDQPIEEPVTSGGDVGPGGE